jgi:hypothetical protein
MRNVPMFSVLQIVRKAVWWAKCHTSWIVSIKEQREAEQACINKGGADQQGKSRSIDLHPPKGGIVQGEAF